MSRPILIVEDDNGIREMLADCLADAGYHTVEAPNGMAALGLLRGGLLPSLILLDLVMPLMNGQDFLSALRCEGAPLSVPVVVLTADQREHEHAAQLGVSAVVTKPMEIETLLAVVERQLKPRLTLGGSFGHALPTAGEVVGPC